VIDCLVAGLSIKNSKPIAKTLPQEPVDRRASILIDVDVD
jgi:hypothetical protein